MKFIKSYQLFESNKFLDLKDVIEELKTICLELEDEGFTYKIIPHGDIQIKLLSLQVSGIMDKSKHEHDDFKLSILKKLNFYGNEGRNPWDKVFNYSAVSETVDRIVSFMESEGWDCFVDAECPDFIEQKSDEMEKVDFVLITFRKK